MKKKTLTLLEILVVIFLITLITGAIGYNMRGTLDKGRKFRTEQAMIELRDLLMICISEREDKKPEEICKNPAYYLKESGLAKDPNKLIEDGWGERFIITYANNEIDIQSTGLAKHLASKK